VFYRREKLGARPPFVPGPAPRFLVTEPGIARRWALALRDGIVPNAFGHDKHFSLGELDGAFLHLNSQSSLNNEKEFIFVSMAVPGSSCRLP
jgi:hypothetical protein